MYSLAYVTTVVWLTTI